MSSLFSSEIHAEFEQISGCYPSRAAAVLPVLHVVQREFGFVSAEAEEEVAALLGIPPVRVHEVLTFYHMFHPEPVGRYHFQFCRTLPCALRGAKKLVDHLAKKLGVAAHEVTADKRFSFESVECLAACGNAPALQLNEDYCMDMTPEKLDELLDELK